MNTVSLIFDLAVVAIIVAAAVAGKKRGLIASLIGLFRWIICILAAGALSPFARRLIIEHTSFDYKLARHVASGINSAFTDTQLFGVLPMKYQTLLRNSSAAASEQVADTISRLLLTIIAFLVLLIFFRLLSRLVLHALASRNKQSFFGRIDSLLGLLFGMAKGFVLVCLILLVILPILSLMGPQISGPAASGLAGSTLAGYLYYNNPLLLLLSLF